MIESSIIDHKDKESYSDERINHWKYSLLASHFCNLRRFAVSNATNRHYQDKPCNFFFGDAPNPNFCVPSQFVSWSAQALEPQSETYVSALHDM